MKFTKQVFSLLFISSLFFACSKDDGKDGATGPAGSQGEQGVAGTDGADGAQGEQGQTGTANVIFSDWIVADLPGPAASSNSQLLATLGSNDVDPDTDVVLVYGRHAVNALLFEVSPLPFILPSQNEYYGFAVGEGFTFFTIRVEPRNTNGGVNLFTYFDDFRYVIIPGGVSTSGKSSLDYSKMSYEEIVEHFNIPE